MVDSVPEPRPRGRPSGSLRLTRRERIKLLLGTYKDVFGPDLLNVEKGDRGFESRALSHGELWREGSYADVQRGLDRLRTSGFRSIYWHTVEAYVNGHPASARRRKADAGVDLLAKWLPGNIYVPQSIAENAGYPITEAKAAARPRERSAA